MFKCSKCDAYESEINHLRSINKDLTDRLMALANPRAYQYFAPQDTDGTYSSKDAEVAYDAFGAPVFLSKGTE